MGRDLPYPFWSADMKYTKEQNLELRKAVANFNKKRKRLEQKGVSPSLLPSKASVKALKLAYDNKRDLNSRLNQLSKFTARGSIRENQKGIQGTDELFKYRQQELNKRKQSVSQKLVRLKRTKTPYKSVKEDAELNLKAREKYLDKDIEQVDLNTLQKLNKNALSREELAVMDERYYNNVFKMFYQEAQYANYDAGKRKAIENELRKLSPQQLVELTETDPIVKSIVEQYEGSKKEAKTVESKLFNTNILNETLTLGNKLDALYDALPAIKSKYGVE